MSTPAEFEREMRSLHSMNYEEVSSDIDDLASAFKYFKIHGSTPQRKEESEWN